MTRLETVVPYVPSRRFRGTRIVRVSKTCLRVYLSREVLTALCADEMARLIIGYLPSLKKAVVATDVGRFIRGSKVHLAKSGNGWFQRLVSEDLVRLVFPLPESAVAIPSEVTIVEDDGRRYVCFYFSSPNDGLIGSEVSDRLNVGQVREFEPLATDTCPTQTNEGEVPALTDSATDPDLAAKPASP